MVLIPLESGKFLNSTRASYNHAQYLKQRTEMMQFWSDFVDETYAKYYPS